MLHKYLLQLNRKTIGTLEIQEVSEYMPVLAFKEELKVRSVVLVFELKKIYGKNLVYEFTGR